MAQPEQPVERIGYTPWTIADVCLSDKQWEYVLVVLRNSNYPPWPSARTAKQLADDIDAQLQRVRGQRAEEWRARFG